MTAALTPRELVAALDRHIVGQDAAKRAVAVAVRTRWRRQQLPPDLRAAVTPKNLLLIGPTGVGKTELARRLAALVGAPFLKVEATKFTEVGYVGRDVEGIVRDLADVAAGLVKRQLRDEVRAQAADRATDQLLDLLVPPPKPGWEPADPADADRRTRTREKMRALLLAGELDDRTVEVQVESRPGPPPTVAGLPFQLPQMDGGLQGLLEQFLPKSSKPRTVTVKEARGILAEQAADALTDAATVGERAVALAEDHGIVFLDEIDKVCGPDGRASGPDVSRQGVQRDLLPIVEGTTVATKYGPVRTDHVLFLAAGAFHAAKPSDLMPELQGRFPVRVELADLTRDDLARILTEPDHALTRQYAALLAADGVELTFTADGVAALADLAFGLNQAVQNIGARRLHTLLEKVVEGVSFDAPDRAGTVAVVDAAWVHATVGPLAQREDISRYIL